MESWWLMLKLVNFGVCLVALLLFQGRHLQRIMGKTRKLWPNCYGNHCHYSHIHNTAVLVVNENNLLLKWCHLWEWFALEIMKLNWWFPWLLSFNQGKLEYISFESLAHELLETNKCYLLDSGAEMYVWMGRSTSLQERKGTSEAAEVTSCFPKLLLHRHYIHSKILYKPEESDN